MDTTEGLLIAIGWVLLRFGLPIIMTILVVRFFKRLDERWAAEGENYRKEIGIAISPQKVRCWLLNNCPEEKYTNCEAYQNQSIPCWQHFRGANRELKERCMGCAVFRGVPMASTGD